MIRESRYYYAGIDVSLENSSICVVDGAGKIVCEAKVASEPDALAAWFCGLEWAIERIGMEAGPLSQWLHAGMREKGLAVELLETRHVRTAFNGWLVRWRRLVRDFERRLDVSEAMIHIAMGSLLLRRVAHQ